MNGMAAAEKFYETAGKQMIRAKFPEYESRIAAGLSGQGSDCAGFDDEVSKDHDLEAGFCLWISEEDQKAIGFPLMRAYTKLSREYNGSSSSGHVSFLTGMPVSSRNMAGMVCRSGICHVHRHKRKGFPGRSRKVHRNQKRP